MDKSKINAFWKNRAKISDARIATNYRDDGRLAYDIKFIEQYLETGANVLDLGAGTCTLAELFVEKARGIVAVDKYQELLDKASSHPNLKKVCSDVVDFSSSSNFDIILLFGVVNFIASDEEFRLYQNCAAMLTPGGTFLVKNQCGIDEEVIVDNYSEELRAHYHARYPAVARQHELLSKLFDVETIDIYPPHLNRWANTHFYGFVCRGKQAKI